QPTQQGVDSSLASEKLTNFVQLANNLQTKSWACGEQRQNARPNHSAPELSAGCILDHADDYTLRRKI
ncbi:MAG: hypothetical protein V7618_07270, partial [Rhodoglobus sp.]